MELPSRARCESFSKLQPCRLQLTNLLSGWKNMKTVYLPDHLGIVDERNVKLSMLAESRNYLLRHYCCGDTF